MSNGDKAALPGGIRVKALEWGDAPFKYGPFTGPEVVCIVEGHGIGGRFAIAVQCDDGQVSLFSHPTCERFQTLVEAQTAAQADYEAAVLGALEISDAAITAGASS